MSFLIYLWVIEWQNPVICFVHQKDFFRLMILLTESCVEVRNEIQQTLVAVLHQENTEETGTLNFKFFTCSVSRCKSQPTSSIFFYHYCFKYCFSIQLFINGRKSYGHDFFYRINSFVILIKALFLIYCLVRSVYLISQSGHFCSSLCFGNTTCFGSKIKFNAYL